MKRFAKVYLEISNVCNLNCSFCPGTTRPSHFMDEEEFSRYAKELIPWTDYLYFHIMGEPLLHPGLESLLGIAERYGMRVILTTNGFLLPKAQQILLNSRALHKVNVSLHSFEANSAPVSLEQYLTGAFRFGACSGELIVCYRLWNNGGKDLFNDQIVSELRRFFPKPWEKERQGIRIGNRVYLEYADCFDWPSPEAEERTGNRFCFGLRDQIGILCDGTVVPCCLDGEGRLALGNLNEQPLESILSGDRAKRIYDGFSERKAVESICRRCGYADRFTK